MSIWLRAGENFSRMADLDAERGWIVDQAEGIDRLAPRIARDGFVALKNGTPD